MVMETPKGALRALLVLIAKRAAPEVSADEFYSRRKTSWSRIRFEVFVWLRQQKWSYPRIGNLFNLDHSSIIHGVKWATGRPTTWVTEVLNEEVAKSAMLRTTIARLGDSPTTEGRAHQVPPQGAHPGNLGVALGLAGGEERALGCAQNGEVST